MGDRSARDAGPRADPEDVSICGASNDSFFLVLDLFVPLSRRARRPDGHFNFVQISKSDFSSQENGHQEPFEEFCIVGR